VGRNWRRDDSLRDLLHVHLVRDGAEIGTTMSDGRRVRHPDFGGWLVLSSAGQGGRGLWMAGRWSGRRRTGAVAHRAGEPCPDDITRTGARHG
jgi:hypothetical protein